MSNLETGKRISLGDRVKYKIDGFEGIATGVTDYLFQCRQIHVQPEDLDKDGKAKVGRWIDEPWLDVIKAGVHKPVAAVEQVIGGKKKAVSGAPAREHPPER